MNGKAVPKGGKSGGKGGKSGTPGSPGVKNKRADPFLTPDQQLDVWNQEQDWRGEVNDAEDAFADLETDSKLQKENINRMRDSAVRATQEQMAARGLFRSSLKDTALIDTEKAAEQQRTAIDNMLITAQGRLSEMRAGIASAREPFYKIMNDMAIGNAEEINANLPEFSQEPTAGSPGSPGAKAKPGGSGPSAKSAPKPGGSKGGRRGRVRMPLTRTRPTQNPLYGRPRSSGRR